MTYWIEQRTADVACPACGDAQAKLLLIGAPHSALPDRNVEFARCGQCGSLCCTSPAGDYDELQTGNFNRFLRRYLESTAGPWEMFWPPAAIADRASRSFLDIGCGFGLTVDTWRTLFGQTAHGCDPAQYAREGRRVLGEHIHHALLDDVAELNGQYFDIVYASEVIEHVPDPQGFVLLMNARLSATGVLVLTTPAAEFVDHRNDLATITAALGAGYHSVLFSAEALRSLLRACGFVHLQVERHGERLIAWASMQAFSRVDHESLKPIYLDYLSRAAQRQEATGNEIDAALRAGHAYRLVKERVFSGELAGLAPVMQQLEAMQYDFLPAGSASLDGLTAAVRAVAADVLQFGAVARYHLPQVALLFGVYEQFTTGNASRARQWLELCVQSCEKLCAQSVTNNLEAAVYFWVAMGRLVSYDIAEGRFDAAGRKLARMIASMVEPDAAIGGGVVKESDVTVLLLGCIDAMQSRRQWQALRRLADAVRGQSFAKPAAFGEPIRFAANVIEVSAAAVADDPGFAAQSVLELQRPQGSHGGAQPQWITEASLRIAPVLDRLGSLATAKQGAGH